MEMSAILAEKCNSLSHFVNIVYSCLVGVQNNNKQLLPSMDVNIQNC
jgi:hypothetical protein